MMNLQTIHKYEIKNFILIGLIIISISWLFSKIIIRGTFESIYVICLLILFYILIKSSWELLVLLFIIIFPMASLLPIKARLFPGIDIIEILSLILVVNFLLIYKKFDFNLKKHQKLAVVLAFFFLVIFMNTFYIKHFLIWGLGGISETKLIVRLVKNIIYFLCIAIIISKATNIKTYKSINKGLTFGLILLSISVFFSNVFANLGMQVYLEKDISFLERDFMRASAVGLFGGDAGFFGHYLSVGFGFFLSLIEKKKKLIFIIGIGATFLATLITASRIGFFSIGLILIIFIFKNMDRNKFLVISIIIIIVVLFFMKGDYITERMNRLKTDVELGDISNISRFKYQSFYLNEMMQSPQVFITGMIEKSKLGRWRVPHNQYLGMLYIGGLSYLLFFLILLYKIFKTRKIRPKSDYSFSILYPLVGFIIPYFTNPNELVIYFPLILSISGGVKKLINH